MKVSKLMLCGACALALAACSVDEVTQVNDSDAIKFKAVVPYATRAAATTTNSLEGFTVWAWTDGGVFMDHVTAVGNGGGGYTTSPLYFWPSTAVDFLGVSPVADGYDGDVVYIGGSVAADVEGGDEYYTGHVAAATVGSTGVGGSVKVDVPSDCGDQIDLCYAVATGQGSGSVAMNFRHALSQVVFAARNTNATLGVEIGGVSVCSVYKTGLFTFPEVSTGESLADGAVGTGGITDSQGEWRLGGEYSKASFSAGIDGVVAVPEDGSSVDLTASDGALFLIPQEVEGWDVAGDSHLEGFGAYFRISCRIYENGVQFWPNASEAADADGFAEIAVPVDVVWEQGYKYTYTFVFGDGAGYYPPDDPNHSGDLDGTPVLVPITFTVSVDEFQRTDGVDVSTEVEGDDNDEGDGDGDDDGDDDDDIIPYLTDENFAAYILANFDTDGNGKVSSEEATHVRTITCHTASNFAGIEHFQNLTSFTSYSAEYIDLSQNTALTSIHFSGANNHDDAAPLHNLDLSKNTNLTSLSSNTFNACENLEYVIFPESLTNMGTYTFYKCTALTYVYLPDGLTSIGNQVFYGCTSLESIELPASLTSIGDRAFDDCYILKDVELPEGVTTIGEYAFYNCTALTEINFPDVLESIGTYAFYGSGLTSVVLPATLTSLGSYCFQACHDLESIDFSKTSLESLPSSTLRGCSALVSVELASTMTSVGSDAFYNCSSLTTIELPEALTSIGKEAFYNCSALETITLPEKVESLGDSAFYHCDGFESFYCKPATPPTVGSKTFEFSQGLSNNHGVLYVPEASYDLYEEAGWGSYFGGGMETI